MFNMRLIVTTAYQISNMWSILDGLCGCGAHGNLNC